MSRSKWLAQSAIAMFVALYGGAPWALAQDASAPATDAAATEDSSDIIIVGQRAAQRRGVEIQERADNIVRALSGDDAGKLPDHNVAESVRRLPGVSVVNDQGEGRYVVIRGSNPVLANVTINGQAAAAPEPESRQVKLDDIPAALIGSVVLTDSLTPDLDANAISGQVDINTVTAFDRAKNFAEARLGYGQTDLNDEAPYEGDLTLGGRFGAARDFGAVLAFNFSHRDITSENLQGSSNWRSVNGFIVPDDFRLRSYDLTRERTGAVLNLDWRPSDALSLYWRNTYSRFTDDETRDQLRIAIPTTLTAQTASTGTITGTRGTRYVRRREEDDDTFNSTFGMRYEFGESWLRAEFGYTRAEKTDPLRSEFQFRTGASSVAATYDLSDERYLVSPTNAAAYTPSAYTFNGVNYDRREAVETLWQARVDYQAPLAWGEDSTFQVGLKWLDRDKTNERWYRTYTPVSPAFSLTNATGPDVGSIFDGRYRVGPVISYDLAQSYVTANPGAMALDTQGSVANSLLNDYEASEQITAAYAMGTLHFGALTIIPGVRVEHTEGDYSAKSFSLTSSFDQGFNVFANRSYTDVFPGVNLRYDVSDQLVLRAAITTAIGRPNYYDVVPTVSVDSGANAVTLGNPDLSPLRAVNYDAAIEFYPTDGAVISASVFYKDIDDPIYASQSLQTGVFAGVSLTNAAVTMPRNASSAWLRGLELNFQMQFTNLPAPFDGFGVAANYTWIDSEATGLFNRTDAVPLFFQSPEVGTFQIFYEKYGFTGRIAYSYRDAYLDTVGATTASDIYTDSNGQLDVRGAYDVTDNFQIFLEASNLNDATWRRYIGTPHQTVEEERYSWAARAGFSLHY